MRPGIRLLQGPEADKLRGEVEGIEKPGEAVEHIFELHSGPLTWSDLMEVLGGRVNQKTLATILKRLMSQGILMMVEVITPYGLVEAYARRLDAERLIAVALNLFRREGYEVLLGYGDEGMTKHYTLYGVKADILLMHVVKKSELEDEEWMNMLEILKRKCLKLEENGEKA